jgi:DNA helicase HerA-like ATPase
MANGILDGYESESKFVCPLGTDRATGERVQLALGMLNRHGVVTGATGTGKTRTIQGMMEWLSQFGISSVMADGKGDLSGMAREGRLTGKIRERMSQTDQPEWWEPTSVPVQFLALGGKGEGTAVRTTVESYGYKSLAKIIGESGLTPAQTNALGTIFLTAAKEKFELVTIEDLKDYTRLVREDPDSSISGGVCNRIIDALNLFEHNNPGLFGGPEFDVMDLIRTDREWGTVSLIDSSKLQDTPEVLTTFMLWLLESLVKHLPEVGDQELPKLVFFFDEAHLMFADAPKEFVRGVLKIIKRIRSKGVGVFFISQSAADIPEAILEQCANRIQHSLRASTPKQLRELKKTAETFPISAQYDITRELTSMAIGEALVCVIDDDGRPTPPAVTLMYVPRSSMSPMEDYEIAEYVSESQLQLKYLDMEREWQQTREGSAMPPEPEIRVREVATPPKPFARAYSGSTDAVGTIVDDVWGT